MDSPTREYSCLGFFLLSLFWLLGSWFLLTFPSWLSPSRASVLFGVVLVAVWTRWCWGVYLGAAHRKN